MAHPKFYLIDNTVPTFEDKMTMVKSAAHHSLQRNIGEWFEGKHLVKHDVLDPFSPVNMEKLPPHERMTKYIDFILL
jgi:hypothetical protein